MADSNKTAIGSRDDLNIDASRCLRMRFSESSCRHCVDICPHGAVNLDGGLTINPDKCHGCMLCTSVCSVGALEQNGDFNACIAKLSKVPEPILGCIRTKECSNGTVACLGGLSEEHLVALYHTLAGRLTLNLSLCSDCPNHSIITQLRQRLDALSTARLSYSNCRIEISESDQDMNYRDESVDRRSFFKSFRTSLFTSAAVILSAHNEQTERRTDYAGKRLPIRRELLNRTRNQLSQELVIQIRKHFDSCVSFDETCTRCQGCVAICPTGALKTETDNETPILEQLLCTGCGVCQEFCLDGALTIQHESHLVL
jgi:Pyruvate/2-oxoacid:ferredoxin oxidoreductase delta subunit